MAHVGAPGQRTMHANITESAWEIGALTSDYPVAAPRLQRSIAPGQERVGAICLYLLSATWVWLIASSSVVVDPENMYWLARAYPPCRMPVFVMGCLAGRYLIIYNKDRDRDSSSKFMCPAPVTWGPVKTADLATFIYLAAIPFGGTQVFNGIRERDALRVLMRLAVELLLSMLYFDWAISLCTHESWTRSLFSSRPMRWLGNISMSFYQIHLIVFELLVLAIGSAPVWIIAVSLVTSLFIGWLTYRYVEKPAQRLVLKYCLPKRTPKVVNSTAERTGHSAPDNVGRDQSITSPAAGEILGR